METFELWPGGPKMEKSGDAAPIGTDSILLADFARLGGVERALDMGSGSGIISILLLCRSAALKMDLVEIMPQAAELSRRNMALNGLEGRSSVTAGDLRALRQADRGKYGLIVTNPPYYSVSGGRSPDGARSAARDEGLCTLAELCRAAAGLLGQGGRFCMVYPARRMAEAMCELSSAGLQPKRLRLVQARADLPPSVFLIECVRGGKPSLTVEPVLILKDGAGHDTEEVKRIYHL